MPSMDDLNQEFRENLPHLQPSYRGTAKKRNSKKAIRQDHHLMIATKRIEQEIQEICEELSKEFGIDINWNDAKELAAGGRLCNFLKPK